MHEPRGKTGLALAYALSPTGSDHQEATNDTDFADYELILDNVFVLELLKQ